MSFLQSVLTSIGHVSGSTSDSAVRTKPGQPTSLKRKASEDVSHLREHPRTARISGHDRIEKRNDISISGTRNLALSPVVGNSASAHTSKYPRKGSYKEIMARSNLKTSTVSTGRICNLNHKSQAITTSNKLRQSRQSSVRSKLKTGALWNTGDKQSHNSRNVNDLNNRKEKGPMSSTPTVSYKGTVMHSRALKPRDLADQKQRTEIQNADLSDEGSLDSASIDESDDMEAGFSDVEAEEAAAEAEARREDMAEAQLEVRLRKAKVDKKLRLQDNARKAKLARIY